MSRISLHMANGGTQRSSKVDQVLNEYEGTSIEKAEGLAYSPDQNFSGAPSLSPLTTQSIQGTLVDETFKSRALWLWPRLNKTKMNNNLSHEATVVKSLGSPVDPFFSEGGVNAFSEAEFDRITTRAKFISENIEVPDTAAIIRGGLDGNNSALETRTRLGIKNMLGFMERWLIEGDSDVSTLQIDGFRKGVLARGVVVDLKGRAPNSEDIENVVGELQADGRHAMDLEAFTDPRVKRVLTTLDAASGRYPKDRGGVVSRIGGPSDVILTTETGEAPVYSMQLIGMQDSYAAAGLGDGKPTVLASGVAAVSADALSRFSATDVGEYDYVVVPVGDKGVGAPIAYSAVTIGSGEKAVFTLADAAVSATKNTTGMVRYYRLYRTEADGTLTGYIGQFTRAAFGVNTTITDLNVRRPFKRPIFIGEFNTDTVEWLQVQDMIRRPLAQTQTSIPFMLQVWGNLFFKQAQKWAIIDNCAIKA